MIPSKNFVLLLLIIAIGIFLRFWGTIHGSFAFTYDVGRDLLAVQKMILEQKVSLLGPTTGVAGIFYGPWWYLFLAGPFLISGGNPYVITAALNFMGVLMIPVAYVLGREINGKFFGLFLAFLIATSPPLVGFSVQIWNPDLVPTFMLIAITILYFLFKNKAHNLILWLALGIFTALIFEMEASFGFFFMLTIVSVSLVFCIKTKKWHYFVILWAGILLIEIPRIAFELRHDFLQTNSFFNSFKSGNSSNESLFTDKLGKNLLLFWQNWSETLGAKNILISIVSAALTFFALFFWRKNLKKENRFLVGTLLLILLFIFLGFSLYPHALWLHYFIGLPLIYLLLFSFAVMLILEQFKTKNRAIRRNIVEHQLDKPARRQGRPIRRSIILLLVLLLVLIARPVGIYESLKKPFFEGDAAVFRNQIKVLDALYRDANGEKFTFVAYTPPLYTYTWDYLFDWYGKSRYGYTASNKTERLHYLIIEPEFEYPQKFTDWLKVREGDGKFVKKEVIAGGITLEKRLR